MIPIALHIADDHPSFAGHFPGRPLLPGVVLLSEVLEAALVDAEFAAIVGAAPRLAVAKFFVPVAPGTLLSVRFEATAATLRFEVSNGEHIAASGHFERAANSGPDASRSTRMPTAP